MVVSEGHRIGVASAIAYCVGDIVGSGIFVSPTAVLKQCGSVGLSLIIWSACAGLSLFGALCYLELGTAIRRSGNDFAYLNFFGWKPVATAFLFVSCTLSYPSTMAIQTLTLGQYMIAGFQQFIELPDSWEYVLERLIGFVVLWPLLMLNFFSLRKAAGRFQLIATIMKIALSVIIIGTGFFYLIFKGGSDHFHDSFQGTTAKPDNIVMAMYAGLFAYNGWDILNFGSEEVENPRRTLPIAAFAGIGISAVVFVAMNISYFSVLTVQEFKDSKAVAVDFAADTLGGFKYAVPFMVALLLTGNLNSTIFGCSRYLFAGASRGVTPAAIRCVNPESGAPRVAVLCEVLIGIAISFIGNLDDIIDYMSFALWTQRTLTQVGFIYFKFSGKMPRGDDVFEVPIIVPIIFFLISLTLLVIPIWQNFHVAIYGLSLIVAGFVIYFALIFPKNLPRFIKKIDENLLIGAQIIFNALPIPIDTSSGAIDSTPEKSTHQA